ncbi:MAG: hypothetical protein V4773_27940 [Verrucomicrobiota bacterium]
MTTIGTAKILLCLAALFGSGAVCGVAVTLKRTNDPAIRSELEARWIEKRRAEDARRLNLTAEQVETLKSLYAALQADVRGVRERAAVEIGEAARRQAREMWPHLTPEQQDQFLKIGEERWKNWQAKSNP